MRHTQELGLELAGQHVGALDQGGHFVEQGFVFDRTGTVAHLGSSSVQLVHDLGATLSKAGDDRAVIFQGLCVLVGMQQHHGRDLGLKAVALCAVARCQAQRLDRHHGAAMQGNQAVRWAHKVHTAPTW